MPYRISLIRSHNPWLRLLAWLSVAHFNWFQRLFPRLNGLIYSPGHVSQRESSSRSCSKPIVFAASSFSLVLMSFGWLFSLGILRTLRRMCTDDVEADSFLLLTVWQNPFGVCRNCLISRWTVFLGLVSALRFTVVLFLCSVESKQRKYINNSMIATTKARLPFHLPSTKIPNLGVAKFKIYEKLILSWSLTNNNQKRTIHKQGRLRVVPYFFLGIVKR